MFVPESQFSFDPNGLCLQASRATLIVFPNKLSTMLNSWDTEKEVKVSEDKNKQLHIMGTPTLIF